LLHRLRFLLIFVLASLCLGPARAQAEADALGHAELAVSSWSLADLHSWWAALRDHESGRVQDDSMGQPRLPQALLPPADPAAWRAASLPDVHPRHPGQGSEIEMRWYRLRVPAMGRLGALYLPRVVALSSSVLLRTDTGWRVLLDNQPPEREHWAQSLWATMPVAGAKPLELVIALPVKRGAPFSVSRVWVGPKDVLEPSYERRVWLQAGVPQAVTFTLVVLGLFALMLWAKAPAETGHATFALATAAWLARNLHHFIEVPVDNAAADWFWWMTHASLSWVLLLVFLTALRFAKMSPRGLLPGLAGALLLASLFSAPWGWGEQARYVFQYLVTVGMGLVVTAHVNWLGWRRPDHPHRRELRVIGGALLLSLLLGLHDLAVLAGWSWPEDVYLMPFAALAVMLSFMYAVQRRYAGRVERAMFQNSQLQQSLDVQADALALQVKRLQEAERQQALLLERQRLMADMHDGLGSSLLSALVAVEQGSMSQDTVVEVLRECVDDLRLVIDSLEPVGHDLVSLLATMRYRLGKRLHAGGLKLEWDVQDLPQLSWLEPPDALHVLRLMQEALNNVVKHARASRVRIATRHQGDYVEIRVEDDGAGFDVETVRHGRGLKSQIKRAQRLGGRLRVESAPGVGTRLSLRLPLQRKEAPPEQAPV
jgi:signal transduction histidine kinase